MGTGPSGVSIVAQMADRVTEVEAVLRKLKKYATDNPEATLAQAFDYLAVTEIFDEALKGTTK